MHGRMYAHVLRRNSYCSSRLPNGIQVLPPRCNEALLNIHHPKWWLVCVKSFHSKALCSRVLSTSSYVNWLVSMTKRREVGRYSTMNSISCSSGSFGSRYTWRRGSLSVANGMYPRQITFFNQIILMKVILEQMIASGLFFAGSDTQVTRAILTAFKRTKNHLSAVFGRTSTIKPVLEGAELFLSY